MDFDEYERQGREAYAAFAATVEEILTVAIGAGTGYRLQQVKVRAKQPDSLRKKLEGRGVVGTTTLEDDIKDLAGCRVIFYTNSDVTRFINSGIIHENFDVLEAKIHHPQREIEDAAELYTSNHYIVRLRPERIALPEYAGFAGMRCEVQIQTILNHAWAEMAHDTIYKAPALGGFGTREFEGIKSRMQKIALKYLVPAGYEFQKIASDFERLIEGKELFDGDALEAIVEAADNNVRAEALEKFAENIFQFYDDRQAVYPEIVERMIAAVERARLTPSAAIETPYGALPGKTYGDVVKGVAGFLTRYCYFDIEATFNALCTLYSWAGSEEERKPLLSLGNTLAQHELHVWRQYGPIVQMTLADRVEALGENECRGLGALLVKMLSEILGTEVRATTSSSSAVTLQRGAVTVSEELRSVRTKAIDLLKRQFALSESEEERGDVLQALQAATRRPVSVGYSNELVRLVMDDTRTIVEFQTEIAPTLSFELLQTTEDRVHRCYWTYAELPEAMREDQHIVAARAGVEAAALAFRDIANANPDFMIYKTLVGFNSVFPPAWEGKEFNHKQETAYRAEQVDALLATVNEASADAWFDRINRCAQTESSDLATFPVFGNFLEQLAEVQPGIALGYIDRLEGALRNFLPSMLDGLMRSAERARALARIDAWIREGEHIGHIAWYLRFTDAFDEDMLHRVLDIAVVQGDRKAVRNVLIAAVDQFADHPGTLIEAVFLPALQYLEAAADFSWVQLRLFSWFERPIIQALNEEQATVILHILVHNHELESGSEYIAATIAKRWPARVVEFIGERQAFARTDAAPPRYDAVPFTVHQLQAPLAAVPDILLDEARNWFDADPQQFSFDGARLLASVFPNLENGIEERLSAFLAGGDEEDLAFVLGVLSAFEGRACIYELMREIVGTLTPESHLLGKAQSVFDETGVVSGEFGFAELHAERKALLEPWLDDLNETVRIFAVEKIRDLDLGIAAETRSAEASIALRKLDYGEELDGNEGE